MVRGYSQFLGISAASFPPLATLEILASLLLAKLEHTGVGLGVGAGVGAAVVGAGVGLAYA